MKVDVKWEIRVNRVPKVTEETREAVRDVIRAGAFQVQRHARRVVPVDTGRLRDSIRPKELNELQWEVRTGTEYAIYVEYGTRRMRPRPYMRPAAERVRGWLEGAARKAIKSAAK